MKVNINIGDTIQWYGNEAKVLEVYSDGCDIQVMNETIYAYNDEILEQNKELGEYLDHVTLSIELYKRDGMYCAYIGDDMGGSGIEATGETKDEACENLAGYIKDYFNNIK